MTVELDVPPYGEGRPKGTAWFHGYGDAPLRAARRAIGKCNAIDAVSHNPSRTIMFKEVKERHDFADAEQGLINEICDETEARAGVTWPDDLWKRALPSVVVAFTVAAGSAAGTAPTARATCPRRAATSAASRTATSSSRRRTT